VLTSRIHFRRTERSVTYHSARTHNSTFRCRRHWCTFRILPGHYSDDRYPHTNLPYRGPPTRFHKTSTLRQARSFVERRPCASRAGRTSPVLSEQRGDWQLPSTSGLARLPEEFVLAMSYSFSSLGAGLHSSPS